jgi:hypothetical protein
MRIQYEVMQMSVVLDLASETGLRDPRLCKHCFGTNNNGISDSVSVSAKMFIMQAMFFVDADKV